MPVSRQQLLSRCARSGALPPAHQRGVRNGGHERPGAAAAAAAGRAGQGDGALTHENAVVRAAAAGLRPPLQAAGVLLADERALGARAHGGPPARPVANGLLANGLARGRGLQALATANGVSADDLALGALALLAVLHGAADLATRLGALDLALGALQRRAAMCALGSLANGVADHVTDGGIALPQAHWMAALAILHLHLAVSAGRGGLSDSSRSRMPSRVL